MAGQFADGLNVDDLVTVCVESEVLGHLPDKDFPIVRGRGNYVVVEGVPAPVLDGAGAG
jgi:hypothetical protein